MFDVFVGDVKVNHDPNSIVGEVKHVNAVFSKFSDDIRRRFVGFCIDHVGLNAGKVHRKHWECIQHVGDNKRPAVVFIQTIHMVVEGVDRRGGEDGAAHVEDLRKQLEG